LRFLGLRFLGLRFLGLRFLGLRFLGLRFLWLRLTLLYSLSCSIHWVGHPTMDLHIRLWRTLLEVDSQQLDRGGPW